MLEAVRQQTWWKRALTWVLCWPDSPECKGVIKLFGCISWGMGLGLYKVIDNDPFIRNISDLLTFTWLRDTHMEVAASVFNGTASHEWWVCGTGLVATLELVLKESRDNMAENPVLKAQMDIIDCHEAWQILLPVNLNNNHWIVVHVDLEKHVDTYGALSPQLLYATNAYQHLFTPKGIPSTRTGAPCWGVCVPCCRHGFKWLVMQSSSIADEDSPLGDKMMEIHVAFAC